MVSEKIVKKRHLYCAAIPHVFFEDGMCLVVQLETKYRVSTGLYSVGLYQKEQLEAGIAYGSLIGGRGFWSRGEVSQREFADYFKIAVNGISSNDTDVGFEIKFRPIKRSIELCILGLEKEEANALKERPSNVFFDSPLERI